MPFPSKFIFEDNVSIEGKDPFEIKDVSLKEKKKTHTQHTNVPIIRTYRNLVNEKA